MLTLWRDFIPFWPIFRSRFKFMAIGIFLGILGLLAAIGLLGLSGWFIAATAFAGLMPATAKVFNFFIPSIGVRLLAVTRTLARYAERLACHDATFRILESLRTWFYLRLEPLAPARLMRHGSGDVLSRIVGDIDSLDHIYLRVFAPVVMAGVAVAVLFLILTNIDGMMAMVVLAVFITAGGAVPWWSAALGRRGGRRLVRLQSRLRDLMVQGIQGMAEVLVFDIQQRYLNRILADHEALLLEQRRMAHLAGLADAFLTLLSGAAVLGVLAVGGGLVNSDIIGGEMLTFATLAVMAAFEAVWPLPAAFQFLSHTQASARRLTDIVDAAPQVTFPESADVTLGGFDLVMEGIGFHYPGINKWVLKNFSLEVRAGSRIALVGASGSGKSTLVHLLMRFWDPQEGRIYLGGQDIRILTETDLRRHIVLISQKAYLFNGTIRSNLLLADPNASDQALWQALAAAQLDTFAAQLPQQLDTWIGEGGKTVSGGQMQRLALARAYLRKAPIWVLDEPTEGLDPGTESALMDTLLAAAKGRTLIVVTHRRAVTERFDSLVRLEE